MPLKINISRWIMKFGCRANVTPTGTTPALGEPGGRITRRRQRGFRVMDAAVLAQAGEANRVLEYFDRLRRIAQQSPPPREPREKLPQGLQARSPDQTERRM